MNPFTVYYFIPCVGRVINYRLLDYKWRFSALPFQKIRLKYSCDTVLKTHHFRHKNLQLMTRPKL